MIDAFHQHLRGDRLTSIVESADEELRPISGLGFLDEELHRDFLAAGGAELYRSTLIDDILHSRPPILLQIAVMVDGVGLWHQHFDVFANNVSFLIAPQNLRCLPEGHDLPRSIDSDDG